MSCAPVPSPCSDPCPHSSPAPSPSQGVRAAYWPSFKEYPASSINTSYFTHIYYAFLLPDRNNTYELAITPRDLQKLPEFINVLRAKIPSVKTMLSIGGAGEAKVFSEMAGDKSSRKAFINSSIKIAREYEFDGLDLDWEYPKTTNDMSNLGLLYKEWREKLKKDPTNKPRLLLTSAVHYASEFTWGEPRSYPGKDMAAYLDWISPMCFDYYGSSWADFTGAHAALKDPNNPKIPNRNTDYGIESWIKSGVPAEKIVMGLPIFGHTWKLQDKTNNGIGAPAYIGENQESQTFSYSEVIKFNREKKATIKYDNTTESCYSYAGDTWIGYDNADSIKRKVEFARSKKLGGYFLWAIGYDKDWKLTESASCAWGN